MGKYILICDDHPAIRKGVRLLLSAEFPDVIFEEASNVNDARKKLDERKWSMIILDVNMPGRSGLEFLEELKKAGNPIPVLVFSMQQESGIAIRVMRLGAAGFLSKTAPDDEFNLAVRTILNGRKFITASLAEMLADNLHNPSNGLPHEHLSEREFDTFIMLAKGRSVSEIAGQLSLSVQTVSTYKARIHEKTGMKTISEIAQYAMKNGLI